MINGVTPAEVMALSKSCSTCWTVAPVEFCRLVLYTPTSVAPDDNSSVPTASSATDVHSGSPFFTCNICPSVVPIGNDARVLLSIAMRSPPVVYVVRPVPPTFVFKTPPLIASAETFAPEPIVSILDIDSSRRQSIHCPPRDTICASVDVSEIVVSVISIPSPASSFRSPVLPCRDVTEGGAGGTSTEIVGFCLSPDSTTLSPATTL